jgi:hypothetical protein
VAHPQGSNQGGGMQALHGKLPVFPYVFVLLVTFLRTRFAVLSKQNAPTHLVEVRPTVVAHPPGSKQVR